MSTLLRPYAFIMLFINVSYILVNAMGLFPMAYTVLEDTTYTKMTNNVNELKTTFQNSSSGMDYLMVSGYVIVLGSKVIIEFFTMIFFGFGEILKLIGFPELIWKTVSAAIGGVMLYEFGMLLLGRD